MILLPALFYFLAVPSASAQSCNEVWGCPHPAKFIELTYQIEQSPTPDETWSRLANIKPIYSGLSKRQQRQLMKVAYRSLAEESKYQYKLPIFSSTLVKLTKQAVRSFFSESTRELTELTYMRESDGSIRPVIIGTSEVLLHTSVQTSGGFWFHKFNDTIPIHWNSQGSGIGSIENIKWRHNGTAYSGSIKVTARPAAGIVAPSLRPDYESLWRDTELNGLVVLSNTFSHRSATRIASHYLSYFAEQGYVFSESRPIADTLLFIKDTIASGETDYVIKEAHSQGDSRTIVSVASNSLLLTGTKPLDDGREEAIRIIVPQHHEETSQRFDFRLLAQTIGMRELTPGTQLILVNSNCDSMFNARNEVALVASPILVNIAASTTTTSFVNENSDPKRGIIEGIRKGLTWAQIRQSIENSPRFKEKHQNDFIFPHQKEYLDNFVPRSEILLGVEVTITDDRGIAYFLSDRL
jgi:hypothetical protein